jgi:hypothetical protein
MKVTSQMTIPSMWHLQMTMPAAQAEDGVEKEATVETVNQLHESSCAKWCYFYTQTRARTQTHTLAHTHTHLGRINGSQPIVHNSPILIVIADFHNYSFQKF